MNKFASALMLSGALLSGCATTHPGTMANTLSGDLPLKVSAECIDGGADSAFQLFSVTIENMTVPRSPDKGVALPSTT